MKKELMICYQGGAGGSRNCHFQGHTANTWKAKDSNSSHRYSGNHFQFSLPKLTLCLLPSLPLCPTQD